MKPTSSSLFPALVGLALFAFACETVKTQSDTGLDAVSGTDLPEPGPLPDGNFAAPQGVVVAGDHVFVTNTNTTYKDQTLSYGTGFVTVVRLLDFKVVNRIPLVRRNPTTLAAANGKVYVLCSGETTFDGTAVRPAGGASIEVIDAASAAKATGPEAVIPLDLAKDAPFVGYPASLVLMSNGKFAYAGSGTSAAIFKFDLAAQQVLRGTTNPIAFANLDVQDGMVLTAGPGAILYAGSTNRDLLYALDTTNDTLSTMTWTSLDVGKTANPDGLVHMAYRGGEYQDLFVLLSIANSVTAVTTQMGQPGVETGFATTGVYSNRIAVVGGTLVILNSGDNNLTGVDIATRKALGPLVSFAPNTSPYDMTITQVGNTAVAFVTGLMSNTLLVADLTNGKLLGEVKP